MRKSIAAVVPLMAVLAACGGGSELREEPVPSASPTPTTFVVKGSLLLTGEVEEMLVEGACPSFGDGYSDIGSGTQVKVLDPSGAVLAFDSLRGGEPVDPFEHGDGKTYTDQCRYLFSVVDVPEGHDSFGIEISSRGVIQFKRAELNEPVELTLGD